MTHFMCGPIHLSVPEKADLLKGISLDLRSPRLIVITGQSGCGKTSLLRAIAGLNNARVDTRRLNDRVFSQKELPAWRANVTLLLQDAPCLSGTILKNLSCPFGFKNSSGKRFDQRAAKDLLKQAGLSHLHFTSDISRLSGGERHRLNLVRGLLWAPPVLLVDESLSGLEPELADNCFSLLKRYSRKRPAVVICVLHEERLFLQADSLFNLENGTLHRIRPT